MGGLVEIKGSTRTVGLFGYPVEHSLSPSMQNAAFRHCGLDICYVPFAVAPEALGAAFAGVRALGFLGLNLTIPHKVAAMSFVDEIAPEARMVGAINTVVNRDGRLIAYNTDLFGVTMALREDAGAEIKGKIVVLFGAGGAARACAFAFAIEGVGELIILNRTEGRAESLARDLVSYLGETGSSCRVRSGSLDSFGSWGERADILVNATSLGLGGEEGPVSDLRILKDSCVVCDLVYHPGGTPFLRRARERGLKTADGLTVLLYQGAKSFSIWTGEEAPIEVMRDALGAGRR